MAAIEEKDKGTGTTDTNNTGTEQKPKTIEEMFNELRQSAVDEKTSAQKMKTYYALTDVMKSLGHMGGAAIGGAIGGDALVGVPTKEYKPNRGYLDAIENAKKATDRLRSLDDTAFQLAYNKQQRDEQWAREDKKIEDQKAYDEQVRKDDREFRIQLTNLTQQFQAEQAELEREFRTATMERQAEIEKELLAKRNKFEEDLINLRKTYGIYDGNDGSGGGGGGRGTSIPIQFKDGTTINIDKRYLDAMKEYFVDEDNDVDDKNVMQWILNNPSAVQGYLERFGVEFPERQSSITQGLERLKEFGSNIKTDLGEKIKAYKKTAQSVLDAL